MGGRQIQKQKGQRGGQPRWNRAHVRALGLANVEEYRAWCQEHGFEIKAEKSWRQEREELRFAERLEKEAGAKKHIEALGLAGVEEYRLWCREHGLGEELEKSIRQRRRELELIERLKVDRRLDEKRKSIRPKRTVTAEHLEALGLADLEEYRLWCLEQGLSDALNKSEERLRKERELAQLSAGKEQRRRPGEVIEAIHAGEVEEEELQVEHLRQIHTAFAGLDREGGDALLQLLLQVARHTGLLEKGMAISRLGEQEGNTFVEGVIALAGQYRDWLRPVEKWRPESRNPRRQFGSLARHLLARYEVPLFMDTAWFRGDREEGRQQQEWFKHVGVGKNIRTADIPLQLSKMMAHHFLEAPAHCTIEEALRWGQIVGQGGDICLAEAVIETRLGSSFADEEFWEKVILFLVGNRMLDPMWVKPIVDYIYMRKYERQEVALPGGQVEHRDPPEPNFSMKSRSIPKLLRRVEEWNAQLRKEAKMRRREWKNSGLGEFSCAEEEERTGGVLYWTIQELLSTRELNEEGKAMRHCVGSYSNRCNKGQMSIWSVQVEEEPNEPRRVMTIAIDNKRRIITQARGRCNALHGFMIDDSGRVPIREEAYEGDIKSTRRLDRGDRLYLQRAPRMVYLWMVHEEIK